jgi:hypothetical protein
MKKLTTEKFIEKARKVHGNKYDYSKVEYKNAHTKVCIICPIHGEFWQIPNDHLNGSGCPKCKINKIISIKKMDEKKFIEKSKKIHGDKYDYSKVEYINSKTKVCIICPIHGEFWQKPNNHLRGQGCLKCGCKVYDTNTFISEACKIHGDKYDYSKVEYKGATTKVCIICPEHGEFWQKPNYHINNKSGCPSCSQSHLENDTYSFLKNKEIIFEQQKKFNWLGLMRLDFYLPEYNIAIECQGIQHYQPIEFFGGKKAYNDLIRRDKIKKQLCEEHNIKMIYVDNNTDFNDLKLR